MDNNSGTLILWIVLIVSGFLLILIRLAKFVNDFGRKKQYLLNEMHRAADDNEYRYWRRELRCLYLCLIPFVTARNVMKVYPCILPPGKTRHKGKTLGWSYAHPRSLNACYLHLCYLPLRCKLGVVYRLNLNRRNGDPKRVLHAVLSGWRGHRRNPAYRSG